MRPGLRGAVERNGWEMRDKAVVVLDVGKTHVKLVAIVDRRAVFEREAANRSVDAGPYRHFDVDGLWPWVVSGLGEMAARFDVEAIVPCSHGSGLAVMDEDGLVLPVMDYTADPPAEIRAAYLDVAPSFAECGCATGPVAVTAGIQLFWQSRSFADDFAKATRILPLAQFWGWRLSGVAASEITQLGAQTHLWNPHQRGFSSFAKAEGWDRLFPPLRPAWDHLGPIRAEIAAATGLPADCPVLCGIHNSSASYLAYQRGGYERDTVLSTGTWIIGFDPLQPIDRLAADRDMVSNSTIHGEPLASSRYMGGQEYAFLAGEPASVPTMEAAEALVAAGTMALPSFVGWGGPYRGCHSRVEGPAPADASERATLAALYTALVTNTCLDLLDSKEGIIVEGQFAQNQVYCRVLAALRPGQTLRIVTSAGGSALGASLLYRLETSKPLITLSPVAANPISGLDDYAAAWRRRAEADFAAIAGGAPVGLT